MDEESFESLKEEVIGKPLVGLLFGEPFAVVVIPLDYSPILTATHPSKLFFNPEDVLTDWWLDTIKAANRRRHELDSHRHL